MVKYAESKGVKVDPKLKGEKSRTIGQDMYSGGLDIDMKESDFISRGYTSEEAKTILGYVVSYLELVDYEGSIIYDEYPDRIGIYRIVLAILEQIKQVADKQGIQLSREKELWTVDMIKLVLYQEIFRRRYEKKNGYLKF